MAVTANTDDRAKIRKEGEGTKITIIGNSHYFISSFVFVISFYKKSTNVRN